VKWQRPKHNTSTVTVSLLRTGELYWSWPIGCRRLIRQDEVSGGGLLSALCNAQNLDYRAGTEGEIWADRMVFISKRRDQRLRSCDLHGISDERTCEDHLRLRDPEWKIDGTVSCVLREDIQVWAIEDRCERIWKRDHDPQRHKNLFRPFADFWAVPKGNRVSIAGLEETN